MLYFPLKPLHHSSRRQGLVASDSHAQNCEEPESDEGDEVYPSEEGTEDEVYPSDEEAWSQVGFWSLEEAKCIDGEVGA